MKVARGDYSVEVKLSDKKDNEERGVGKEGLEEGSAARLTA